MFQDALMESDGKLTTKSKYFSLAGLAINGSLLLALIVWPLLHPLALPKQALAMLLVAPAPPAAAVAAVRSAAAPAARAVALSLQLLAPNKIPSRIAQAADATPSDGEITGMEPMPGGTGSSSIGDVLGGVSARAPMVQAAPAKRVAISSGVMAGNRIGGSAPAYPAIARAARVQGTVVIAAMISKSGSIENLRIVNGPPMLVGSAIDSVKTWHYKPYLLNGEPVEVETTINVVFNLGN